MAPPIRKISVFWRPTRNSPEGVLMPTHAWRSNRRLVSAPLPLSALTPSSRLNFAW
jgi:hypothetical protein